MLIRLARPPLRRPRDVVLRVKRGHRLAGDLRALVLFGGQFGFGREIISGSLLSPENGVPFLDVTRDGPGAGLFAYQNSALRTDLISDAWQISGEITVAARLRVDGARGVIARQSGTGGITSNAYFELSWGESSQSLDFNRSNAGGWRWYRSGTTGLATTGAMQTLAASQAGDISTAPRFYRDGVYDTVAPVSVWTNGATGAASGTAQPIIFGRRVGNDRTTDGAFNLVVAAARVWSDEEQIAFHGGAYALLEEAPRWYTAPTTVHDFTAASIASASTVGTPALAQIHALGATGIASASSVGTPALAQVHALGATGVASASTVGAPALAQVHALGATGIASASTVGTPILNASPSTTRTLVLPARDRTSILTARSRGVTLPARDRAVTLPPERT